MPEQSKPQAPTVEQISEELHKTRVALNKAVQQREATANEVIELTVSLDQSRRVAQTLQGELAAANWQVAELTKQLASRAEQRAGKRK